MIWLRGVLLFLLLCARDILGVVVSPEIYYPPGIDPGGQQSSELRQGFVDAIILARTVAITFDPCDAYFNRYFNSEDSKFVSDVFRTLANIPLDISMEDLNGNLNPDLSNIVTNSALNPRFSELSIAIGDHPDRLRPDHVLCTDNKWYGYFIPDQRDTTIGRKGIVSICTTSWAYPSLKDIFEPPDAWRGQPGFGCDGLGDHDSAWMTSLGAVILHEILHWAYLFQDDVPDWTSQIPLNYYYPGVHDVRDYAPGQGDPPYPSHGYGPFFAPMLKTLPKAQGQYARSINNADSYVWFAISKYWAQKCNKYFAPSTSENDATCRDQSWNKFLPNPPPAAPPFPPKKRSILLDRLLGYRDNATSRPHSRIMALNK
ncbi:hypothetical protein LTR99_006609 [Exophiala xenobiotica]|uniref:Lysine-specific metallo-endopeptidase domain-containing protein n=1 Tax=Vermiconidia calcicola TaxID=1690605 RepID=A0AAV9Q8W9_9PEZI|nr:hypothetical protein LTR96_007454 [Exophiala xenobiotica]KAK5532567.1 hypothetical protein LTR23_009536 [Chaetothyriales sp. CCFEE 6169]KAK5537779.1 hypothetical protein LTR25_005031 [Vermiconidia calcicola]KAK5301642.1 hypothetical protein LTR99_006609 [Exophiala xenobiotica]KAK5335162.1 hypothetical protein LTR98_008882 [Exophiala xenobiotica]